MTKIALVVVKEILTHMGLNVSKEFESESLLLTADVANDLTHTFIQSLK